MTSSEVANKSHKCSCSGACDSSDTSSGPDTAIYDRKKLLEITSSLIRETHDRISGDRFRLREGDKERLQYLRTLSGLIALHTNLLEKAHAPHLEGLEYPADPLDDLLKW